MTCSAEGRCQATSGADASTADSDNSCASVNFTAKPVIPSIQLVLDRSGSMGNEFGNTSRWEALKAALISPTDGVVTQLQARAYFGVTLYPNPNGTCSFDQTPRALNAASQIQTELDSQGPGGGTPTGDALAQATLAFSGNNAPPADSPAIIVLATDGEPNGCAGLRAIFSPHRIMLLRLLLLLAPQYSLTKANPWKNTGITPTVFLNGQMANKPT